MIVCSNISCANVCAIRMRYCFGKCKHLFDCSFQFGYRGGVSASRPGSRASSYECVLQDGEYITQVKTYEHLIWHTVLIQGGITFVTTKKTCGPYGKVTSIEHTAEGHMLLYISGRAGQYIDQINIAFHKSCNK